ncbi:PIPO, partial [Moroccan watermelon mosaic virus]|uniref:PIPO n=1 Tax=Moroccan watermelon mosaic virus TaxID=167129 RepID=UPI00026515B4
NLHAQLTTSMGRAKFAGKIACKIILIRMLKVHYTIFNPSRVVRFNSSLKSVSTALYKRR